MQNVSPTIYFTIKTNHRFQTDTKHLRVEEQKTGSLKLKDEYIEQYKADCSSLLDWMQKKLVLKERIAPEKYLFRQHVAQPI